MRLCELGDYFRALHGFSLADVMQQIKFERSGRPEKLSQWLERLDYELYVPRSLLLEPNSLWIQRFDTETKLLIEDLLAEEAHLIRQEDRSILLSECLVDQLVSLFGVDLPFIQLLWTHLLELYTFAYKRKFPVDLLLSNFYGERQKKDQYQDKETLTRNISSVLQSIQNRRLAPSLRKQGAELWIHINPQVQHLQQAITLSASLSLKKAPMMHPTETATTTTSFLPPSVSSERDEDYEDTMQVEGPRSPLTVTSPSYSSNFSFSYFEPTVSERLIACRLFQCFQGGFYLRFSELPTTYTKLFQCVLDFKVFVKDGYAYKKFKDWIKSLPFFEMPEYSSELLVFWMKRKDKGAYSWLVQFQNLFQDTMAFLQKKENEGGGLNESDSKTLVRKASYLEALFKRQVRSLFGTVTRIRIASLYAMLLDIYGPMLQVPLRPILDASHFDMGLLLDASPFDVMVHLVKGWNGGAVRYLCMGLEDFVQIDPLPLTDRVPCVCAQCILNPSSASASASASSAATATSSFETRLGLHDNYTKDELLPLKRPIDVNVPANTFKLEQFLSLDPTIFQPNIPASVLATTIASDPIQNFSLASLFESDNLYGLDLSRLLQPLTKKQKMNDPDDMIVEEEVNWTRTKLLTAFLTPQVLPYYKVTQHMPDDFYGDFKVYLS